MQLIKPFAPATFAERAAAKRAFEGRHPSSPLDGCVTFAEEIVREDRDGWPIGVDMLKTFYRKRGAPVPVAHQFNNDPPVLIADAITHRDETTRSSRPGWLVDRAAMRALERLRRP